QSSTLDCRSYAAGAGGDLALGHSRPREGGDMSVQVLAPTRREAVEQRRRKISRVVLAAHIADAVGLLGADLALVVLGISALSGGDPLAAYPAMSLISRAV